MKITLINIGNFKEAEILIEGITVIAGENNTGKSTISKTLFSIIKAYQEAKDFAFKEKTEIRFILRNLDRILWFLIRREKLSSHLDKIVERLVNDIWYFKYEDDIDITFIKKIRDNLKDLRGVLRKENKKIIRSENLIKDIERIEKELFSDIDFSGGYLEKSLNFQIRKNFRKQINNFREEKLSSVVLSKNKKKIFDIEIKNNQCIKFDKLEDLVITEISYIESPLILNKIKLFDSLKYLSPRLLRQIHIPYIEEDLVKKIRIPLSDIDLVDEVKNFIKEIERTIGGKFEVEDEDIFFVEEERKIYPINVASGIKSFGIIYLLLKNGRLVDNTHMLILDEPEVHLHPKWQIKYAELLVKLYRDLGCHILINSHSPDFIQAVRYYSNKYKVIDNVHFYFVDKKDKYSVIEQVDFNLTKIFSSLVEPMETMEDLPFWT